MLDEASAMTVPLSFRINFMSIAAPASKEMFTVPMVSLLPL